MKTHLNLLCCTNLSSRLCRFSHKARLFTVVLPLLFISAVTSAFAQGTTNNCVTVICPPPVVTNYTCSDVYQTAAYPIVVTNRCPNLQIQVNCNPPPGTPLPVGPNPIHCDVTASDGTVVGTCDFTIFVIRDTTPPTIQCNSNIVVSSCPGPAGCGAVVTFPLPPASDNSGFVTVTCNPPSGSTFPCGTTVVTCTAFDRCQLQASCTFTVTVQQNGQPPSIQCPPDITVDTCSNSATVTYSPFVSPAGTFFFCNPPSGSSFPIGTTSVTCVASNGCGTNACNFKVTVRTVPPPTVACTNIVRTIPCGSNCVPVFYPAPAVFNGTLESCNPPSGSCFPLGITIVTCRATNACGQVGACSFEVRIIQGTGAQGPTIVCPTNIVVDSCQANCEIVNYPSPFVSGGTLVGCSPPSGSCFPIGSSAVICAATNACGSNTCSFTVTVRPQQPPTISCTTSTVVNIASCSSNCVPISYPFPPVSNGTLAGCNPRPGTCLPVGSYVITCSATNRCGQSVSCSFNLDVRPSTGQPPSIQCPSNQIVRIPCNSNCVPITYPNPTVGNGVFVGCNPPQGTCLPVGDYNVICRATNACASSTCEFIIHVLPTDPAPPSIQCPSNIVVTAPCGSNCVPVSFTVTVFNGVLDRCNPPSGSCFPLGTTTVTCRATNGCGLSSTCSFDVQVSPSTGGQGPTIRCPTNFSVTMPCNSNCIPVTYPPVTVVNGVLVGCNPPSGTCFGLGNHVVTCFATNPCGSASCEFIVTVIGQTAGPSIKCPSNLVVFLPCGSNCVPVNYPSPTVTGGVLIGCTPPSGTCLPVGIYNVTCTASNNCGQKATCEFQIRVVQGTGQPPIIQCPSNLVFTAPCGATCAPVTYPLPFVTNGVFDGCTVPQNACLPVGTNLVTCRATNNCASSTCSFIIRVIPGQTTLPNIKCPSNAVITLPCNSNCVPISYPLPTVSNGVLVGCNPPPGTCLPVGSYNVDCIASNACGQIECVFPLYVIGGQGHPPIINCPSNITVHVCSTNCAIVQYSPTVVNGGAVVCSPPSLSCFPIGTTTVTCSATNSCGTNSCSFLVTVEQIPFPQIKCPSNIVVTACGNPAGGNGTPVNYPPPIVSSSLGFTNVTCNPPSGSFFPPGTNVVRCCVSDACNRTNCCDFLVIVLPGNPCVKPPAGMVLWLPFDEPFGPIANNIIPGAPPGLHVNGPVPLLGSYVLNSLHFDGVNDFVRVPNYAAILLNASDFSIDAWVLREVPDQGRRVIVSKFGQIPGAVGLHGYEYYLNNGVMNLALGGVVAQNFNSGVIVPLDGNWHHVAVTVQRAGNGAIRFYLDGVLVNVQGGPITAPLGNNNSLYVGASTLPPGPNAFFHGPIDEVEIFRRALTAAEVASLWNAHQSGKCKITCTAPMNVPLQPGACITVNVRVCNNSSVPQAISWTAAGAVITTAQSGSFVLPPFTCTNVPVTLCNPPTVPPGGSSTWTFSLSSGTQCPSVCVGTVVTPGVVVVGPFDPTGVPGTNRTDTVRVSLNGLPPGSPVRISAWDSSMMPDMQYLSLNGLPPGTPWVLGGVSPSGARAPAKPMDGLDIPVRFSDTDPVGLYTILLEADLDGDGTFEPLASFNVENPVVPPPTLRIVDGKLQWEDQGDGLGSIEAADSIEGPWTPIPGGPGTPIDTSGGKKFYRIAVPLNE